MSQQFTQKQLDELVSRSDKLLKIETYNKNYRTRRNAKRQLLIEKAIKQGIIVTDKEVDDYIKSSPK